MCVGGHPTGFIPYWPTPHGNLCHDDFEKKIPHPALDWVIALLKSVEAGSKDKGAGPKAQVESWTVGIQKGLSETRHKPACAHCNAPIDTAQYGGLCVGCFWKEGFAPDLAELHSIADQSDVARLTRDQLVSGKKCDQKCVEINDKFAALDTKFLAKGLLPSDLEQRAASGQEEFVDKTLQIVNEIQKLEQVQPNRAVLSNPRHVMWRREIEKAGFAAAVRAVEDLLAKAGRGEPLPNNGHRFSFSTPFDKGVN